MGTPMTWDQAKLHAPHVKHNGIIQFLNIYNRLKSRKSDDLLWGDEVIHIRNKLITQYRLSTLSFILIRKQKRQDSR